MGDHEFVTAPPDPKIGRTASRCAKCGLEMSIPEEGTWRSCMSPGKMCWRTAGGHVWTAVESEGVPPCPGTE